VLLSYQGRDRPGGVNIAGVVQRLVLKLLRLRHLRCVVVGTGKDLRGEAPRSKLGCVDDEAARRPVCVIGERVSILH